MNDRVLAVKGIGKVSAKPDLIIITMKVNTIKPEYSQTMECASKDIEAVRHALISIGYDKVDLKTTDFGVNEERERYRDKNDDYKYRFVGYNCSHTLKLEFDFDTKRLDDVFTAISKCGVYPKMDVAFSIKDKDAVVAELLENAIANASGKAEVLAKAAGVKLMKILRIDYNWGELRLYSNTQYEDQGLYCAIESVGSVDMGIEPEDIKVNDSVSVVWAIE